MKDRPPTTSQIAEQWTGEQCTLDEMPATVNGKLEPYATVANKEYTAQFSWQAVNRIMQQDRSFSS